MASRDQTPDDEALDLALKLAVAIAPMRTTSRRAVRYFTETLDEGEVTAARLVVRIAHRALPEASFQLGADD